MPIRFKASPDKTEILSGTSMIDSFCLRAVTKISVRSAVTTLPADVGFGGSAPIVDCANATEMTKLDKASSGAHRVAKRRIVVRTFMASLFFFAKYRVLNLADRYFRENFALRQYIHTCECMSIICE